MDIQLPEKKKKIVEEYIAALKKKREKIKRVILYLWESLKIKLT